MAIDMKDVSNIAHLARLHLSAAEQQEALDSITNILKVIDGMQALDTSGVEPLAHANDAAAQRPHSHRIGAAAPRLPDKQPDKSANSIGRPSC